MIDITRTGVAPTPALKLSRSKSMPTKKASAGQNSGKRSLSDVLDEDLVVKRAKVEHSSNAGTRSRDFVSSRTQDRRASTSSGISDTVPNRRHGFPDSESGAHTFSIHVKENISPCGHLVCELEEVPNPVNQEDGYISPTPSYSRSVTPDLSSPLRHPHEEPRGAYATGDDFGADIVSSPAAMRRSNDGASCLVDMTPEVLVRSTPSPTGSEETHGLDLGDLLSIATPPSQAGSYERSAKSTPSTTGPVTPEDPIVNACTFVDEVAADEDLDTEARLCGTRAKIVANGWWNKWALKPAASTVKVSRKCSGYPFAVVIFALHQKPPNLRRIESTITPTGRQSGYRSPRGKLETTAHRKR